VRAIDNTTSIFKATGSDRQSQHRVDGRGPRQLRDQRTRLCVSHGLRIADRLQFQQRPSCDSARDHCADAGDPG